MMMAGKCSSPGRDDFYPTDRVLLSPP